MTWQLMWRNVRAAVLNATLQLLVIYRCESVQEKKQGYGGDIRGACHNTIGSHSMTCDWKLEL